jgi:hypothetical protein
LGPVDDIPDSAEVFGAPVLVLEVIGMFPHIYAEDRFALEGCYGHEGVVLVGGGGDF